MARHRQPRLLWKGVVVLPVNRAPVLEEQQLAPLLVEIEVFGDDDLLVGAPEGRNFRRQVIELRTLRLRVRIQTLELLDREFLENEPIWRIRAVRHRMRPEIARERV